jgi:hypothetical protein
VGAQAQVQPGEAPTLAVARRQKAEAGRGDVSKSEPKPPELMTREEFVSFKAQTQDVFGNKDALAMEHAQAIREAFIAGKPVRADQADRYGEPIPPGYVRDGDRYVLKGDARPKDAVAEAKPEKKAVAKPSAEIPADLKGEARLRYLARYRSAIKSGMSPEAARKAGLGAVKGMNMPPRTEQGVAVNPEQPPAATATARQTESPAAESTDTPAGQTVTSPKGEAEAARKELTPKEQKKYLLAEIDKAIEGAPDNPVKIKKTGKTEMVTIEVPDDGTFTIENHKTALETFRKAANAKFPASTIKSIIPKRDTGKGQKSERVNRGVSDALTLYGNPREAVRRLTTQIEAAKKAPADYEDLGEANETLVALAGIRVDVSPESRTKGQPETYYVRNDPYENAIERLTGKKRQIYNVRAYSAGVQPTYSIISELTRADLLTLERAGWPVQIRMSGDGSAVDGNATDALRAEAAEAVQPPATRKPAVPAKKTETPIAPATVSREQQLRDRAKAKKEAAKPTIIQNSPSLDIRNLDALPKGTGAKYLEAIRGTRDTFIAKQWRRSIPEKPEAGSVFIELGAKVPNVKEAAKVPSESMAAKPAEAMEADTPENAAKSEPAAENQEVVTLESLLTDTEQAAMNLYNTSKGIVSTDLRRMTMPTGSLGWRIVWTMADGKTVDGRGNVNRDVVIDVLKKSLNDLSAEKPNQYAKVPTWMELAADPEAAQKALAFTEEQRKLFSQYNRERYTRRKFISNPTVENATAWRDAARKSTTPIPAMRSVQAQYKGPGTVANGERAAGFTDNANEVAEARAMGLTITKAGNQFTVYSRTAEDAQPLVEHLSKYGYGENNEQRAQLSRLAGYSKAQTDAFIASLPATTAPAAPAAPAVLEDFGEKIGGARKDRVPSVDKQITDDDLANMTFSEIWPKSEVDAIEDTDMAALATALRNEIPAKPRKAYRVKRWVESVKLVRTLMKYANEAGFDTALQKMRSGEYKLLPEFADKVDLLRQLPREHWNRIGKVYDQPDGYNYETVDGKATGKKIPAPRALAEVDGRYVKASNMTELVAAVNERLGVSPETAAMDFQIRAPRSGGLAFINKKGDPLYRKLKEFTGADAVEQALNYKREHRDDLVAAWEAVKESDNVKETDVRRADNRPRSAKDYRNGSDATPQMFTDTFGFRGVEFGNWVSQGKNRKERQGMLNEAFDALMDLADIIGVPPRALSLNGELALGFGSRGHGWASAHYEPGKVVINLTKTRGAGSLAHEWFHALDHYFQRQRPGDNRASAAGSEMMTFQPEGYYEHGPTKQRVPSARFHELVKQGANSRYYIGIRDPKNWTRIEGVRPKVEESFVALVKALDASPMAKRSRLIDRGKSSGYWSRVIERAARAFENYVIYKMAQKGYNNDYLANVMPVDEFSRDVGRYPYLLEEEVAPIAEAFDDLFSTIETKETDAGLAMFMVSDRGAVTPSQDAEYMAAVEAGDMETAQRMVDDKLASVGAMWHGTPSGDLRGGVTGLHVGTKQAATEALEARIGIPADGKGWDGTREYGKTLLAGKDRIQSGQFGQYRLSGYNVDAPANDYYPTKMPTFGDSVAIDPTWKPWIRPVMVVGEMTNTRRTPITDSQANRRIQRKRGAYYINEGEHAGSVSAVLPNGDSVRVKLPDPVTRDDQGNVIPLSERFDSASNDIRFIPSDRAGFYSALTRAVESLPDNTKMPGDQFLKRLEGLRNKGQAWKAQEAEESGLLDFFKMRQEQGQNVTKADALAFLEQNGVRVIDAVKGAGQIIEGYWFVDAGDVLPYSGQAPNGTDSIIVRADSDLQALKLGEQFDESDGRNLENEDGEVVIFPNFSDFAAYHTDTFYSNQYQASVTKYAQYAPPGGVPGTYREVLLTVPSEKGKLHDQTYNDLRDAVSERHGQITAEMDETLEAYYANPSESTEADVLDATGIDPADIATTEHTQANAASYISPHWSEPNVIAHMLMDERRIPLDVLAETQPELADRLRAEGKTDARALHMIEGQSDYAQRAQAEGVRAPQREIDAAHRRIDAADKRIKEIASADPRLADMPIGSIASATRLGAWKEGSLTSSQREQLSAAVAARHNAQQELDKLQPGLPALPMRGDASKRLVIRKMLAEAVAGDFDLLTWSTGEDRFKKWGSQRVDWKKHEKRIHDVYPSGDGSWTVTDQYGIPGPTFPSNGKAVAENLAAKRNRHEKGEFWLVSAQEQTGGEHAGMNIEEAARERGELLESKGQTVRTKEDLRRVIESIKRGDETNVEKLTDRIWDRMQTEPEGTSLPRKEFFEFLYDQSFRNEASAIVKKMDKAARVGSVVLPEDVKSMSTADLGSPVPLPFHAIPLTDAIKTSVAQGQPLYLTKSPVDSRGQSALQGSHYEQGLQLSERRSSRTGTPDDSAERGRLYSRVFEVYRRFGQRQYGDGHPWSRTQPHPAVLAQPGYRRLNERARAAGVALLPVRNLDGIDGAYLHDFGAVLVNTDSPIALDAGEHEIGHAIARRNPHAARPVLAQIDTDSPAFQAYRAALMRHPVASVVITMAARRQMDAQDMGNQNMLNQAITNVVQEEVFANVFAGIDRHFGVSMAECLADRESALRGVQAIQEALAAVAMANEMNVNRRGPPSLMVGAENADARFRELTKTWKPGGENIIPHAKSSDAPGTWRYIDSSRQRVEQLQSLDVNDLPVTEGNRISAETVDRYTRSRPVKHPVVFLDSQTGKYVVDDGNHRIQAAKARGDKTVLAWVRKGLTGGMPDPRLDVAATLADIPAAWAAWKRDHAAEYAELEQMRTEGADGRVDASRDLYAIPPGDKSQIKSSEVTPDDTGRIPPPSEWGQQDNPDARFMPSDRADKAAEKFAAAYQVAKTEAIDAVAAFRARKTAVDVNEKPDFSWWDLLARSPEYYTEKVPPARRVFTAAENAVMNKHRLELSIFNQDNGEGASDLQTLRDFEKANKVMAVRTWRYLLQKDIDAKGYSVQESAENEFKVFDPDGKQIADAVFPSDDQAWMAAFLMEARDLREAGFGEAAAKAVFAFRSINHRGHQQLMKDVTALRATLAEHDLDLPKIVTEDGEFDLFEAIRAMGDRRGYYFPRIRPSGAYVLTAVKEGAPPIREHYRIGNAESKIGKAIATPFTARLRRRAALERQGYTVTLSHSTKPSQTATAAVDLVDMNELIQNTLNQLKALERADLTMADLGLKAEWIDYERKDGKTEKHWTFSGPLTSGTKEAIVAMGGRHYKTDNAWHFVKPSKLIEKRVIRAVANAKGEILQAQTLGQAFVEQMANTIRAQGSRARKIGRSDKTGDEVVRGYEEDPIKAITLSTKSIAGGSAKRLMAREMIAAMTGTDIPWRTFKAAHMPEGLERGDEGYSEAASATWEAYEAMVKDRRIDSALQENAYNAMNEFIKDMIRNDTNSERVVQTIKGVTCLKYLSGLLGPGLVNMTALATTVPPAMRFYGGIPLRQSGKLIARAGSDYIAYFAHEKFAKGTGLSGDDKALFDEISRRGWDEAPFNYEAMAALQTDAGRNMQKFVDTALIVFSTTERFNRVSTIVAAYRGIRANNPAIGHEEALTQAKRVSDRGHGVYGKRNLPSWARGPSAGAQLFRSALMFKTFTHNWLQMAGDIGLKDKKALFWHLVSPAILAGVPSTVLTQFARAVAWALTGGVPPDDLEEGMYQWLGDTLGAPAERFARSGLFGLVGINLKGSLAIGIFDLPTKLIANDWKIGLDELIGAPASMATDLWDGAYALVAKGDVLGAAEKFSPRFAAGGIRAVREKLRGVHRRNYTPVFTDEGERLEPSWYATMLRAINLNPTQVSEVTESQWAASKVARAYSNRRTAIYDRVRRVALGAERGRIDRDEWLDVSAAINDYNADVQKRKHVVKIPLITSQTIKATLTRAGKSNLKKDTGDTAPEFDAADIMPGAVSTQRPMSLAERRRQKSARRGSSDSKPLSLAERRRAKARR